MGLLYCITVSCVVMCKNININEFGKQELGHFFIKEIDEKCLSEQQK